jgi:hypothetical protein
MIFLRVVAQQFSSPTRLPDSRATVSWLTDRSSCPNCNHTVATVREGNIGKKSRHLESAFTVRREKKDEDFGYIFWLEWFKKSMLMVKNNIQDVLDIFTFILSPSN